MTGYLCGRRGANVGGDADRGEHIGLGGSYQSGANQGKLFIFNGDDSQRGSVAGHTKLQCQRWYHIVYTRDGEHVTLYLNGQVDHPELHGTLARQFTTNELFVACRHDGLFPFAGELRDVAVFEGVLAKERIVAHYRGSCAVS